MYKYVSLIVFVSSLLASIPAQAQTNRYVAPFGIDDQNDCSNQAIPCGTIERSINQAANGDTIFVFAGTYTQNSILLSNRQLTFVGQGSAPGGTTIQRQSGGPTEPLGRVMDLNLNSEIELRDLWIRHGNSGADGGGGIRLRGQSELTLQGVRISDNVANWGGALQLSENTSLTVDNSIVRDNIGTTRGGGLDLVGGSTALIRNGSEIVENRSLGNPLSLPRGGGGIFVSGGSGVTLNPGTRLSGNRAEGNTSSHGGGILLQGGTSGSGGDVVIRGAEVRDNHADGDGGGLFISNGSLTVSGGTRIEGNSGRNGGGVAVQRSNFVMLAASSTGNRALRRGGGVFLTGPDTSAVIRYSTISGNETSANNLSSGGGIGARNQDSSQPGITLELTNSTLSGNQSDTASALDFRVQSGDLILRNVTIADNLSFNDAGAIAFSSSPGATATLGNTLLAEQQGLTPNCNPQKPDSEGGNLSTDTSCRLGPNDTINGHAGLLPLFPNGGDTLTHALMPESDAVGNADQDICAGPGVFSLDQRSFPRPLGTPCDVGAYELGELALQVANFSLDDGDLGQFYIQPLSAAGGQPPYTWSSQGNVPPGLELNPDSGEFAGTPTRIGEFTFTVTVEDQSAVTAERSFTVHIDGPDGVFSDRFDG